MEDMVKKLLEPEDFHEGLDSGRDMGMTHMDSPLLWLSSLDL